MSDFDVLLSVPRKKVNLYLQCKTIHSNSKQQLKK